MLTSLKENLNSGLQKFVPDIGNMTIDKMDFSEGESQNLITLNVAELYEYGCNFWLGFAGNEDRLIYSLDFEKIFSESHFPRGTFE